MTTGVTDISVSSTPSHHDVTDSSSPLVDAQAQPASAVATPGYGHGLHQLLSPPRREMTPVATTAAVKGVLTVANVRSVQAEVVVEGANGPTTSAAAADEILEDQGVLMVPDILANAGGVIVSYVEWVQSHQACWWLRTEVDARLEHRMLQAWNRLLDVASARGLALREAATVTAVDRVADPTASAASAPDPPPEPGPAHPRPAFCSPTPLRAHKGEHPVNTIATPATSAFGSRRRTTSHRTSGRRRRIVAATGLCSDGFPAVGCPYCCGPESD